MTLSLMELIVSSITTWDLVTFTTMYLQHTFVYSAKAATSTLCVHINKWHILTYLIPTLKLGREWVIQVLKPKGVLAQEYTLEELKVFMKSGINLDSIPLCFANGVTPAHAAANGQDNIPPFLLPIFHTFLVNFIAADDHQFLYVVECLEFQHLLLHLREDLMDKDISHHTMIKSEIIDMWKCCFNSLKRKVTVHSMFLIFIMLLTHNITECSRKHVVHS